MNTFALGICRAKKSHYQLALSAGLGYGCMEGLEPYCPQATREHFKNHPTHDSEIEPTISGYMGCGIGHPWGAFGLLY